MNILLLTTHANTGGITSYLLTLAQGMIRQGHRVWLVSSGGDRADEFRRLGVELVTLDIRTKSVLSLKIYRPLGRLARLIEDERIDVLHAQTRITQVMGALLSRRTRRPLVTTCHGFFRPHLGRRIFPAWGERVIAISPAVKEQLENEFLLPARQVALVTNGIDITDFPQLNEEERQQRRRDLHITGGPVLGTIGRLSDVKGQDILLDALPDVIKRFPGVRLVIVGDGKMETILRRQAELLDIAGHVDFRTGVKDSRSFLPAFDVFVMPSRQEGLGLAALEAQASALPVVASRVGGLAGVIQHGSTGLLVDPENAPVLAHALIDVLGRLRAATDMGRQAREQVARNFPVNFMIERTVTVYEEAVRYAQREKT